MTDGLEGGNKGGMCFSCVELGYMGYCPRNAWSKNRKNGFKGKEWVGVEVFLMWRRGPFCRPVPKDIPKEVFFLKGNGTFNITV